jgi:hypothetical protein
MPDSVEDVHGMLRADVSVIRDYGGQRLDDWVEVWFENEPTVRLITAFSNNVALHEAELRRLVAHPERMEVRSMPWSQQALHGILDEVHELATTEPSGALCGWGLGTGQAVVTLCPDRESFAAALDERFGDALRLTVGVLPYPPSRSLARYERVPGGRSPAEYIAIDGLETELVLTTSRLSPGEDGLGQLVLRNSGSGAIVRSTGQPLAGRILDWESGQLVGGGYRALRGTGKAIRLDPGAQDTIAVCFGTASYNPALGYCLPPGRYRVQVELDVGPIPGSAESVAADRGSRQFILVPPAALTIVAP